MSSLRIFTAMKFTCALSNAAFDHTRKAVVDDSEAVYRLQSYIMSTSIRQAEKDVNLYLIYIRCKL